MFIGHLPAGYLITCTLVKRLPLIVCHARRAMVIGLVGAVAPDFDLSGAIWWITGNDIIIFTLHIGHCYGLLCWRRRYSGPQLRRINFRRGWVWCFA